jgi:hypothetical protein
MDQIERVRAILRNVSYKPTWRIMANYENYNHSLKYTPLSWRRIILTATFKAPDVTCPSKDTVICGQTSLPEEAIEHLNDAQIVDYFIRRVIYEAEDHEFKEWFKYDGVCVFNPHPEEVKQ